MRYKLFVGATSNFVVTRDGQVGLVDERGEPIIPVRYAEIFTLREGQREAYVVVDSYGNHGLRSITGAPRLETIYEAILCVGSTEIYAVRENGEYKLVSIFGETILEGDFGGFTDIRGENIVARSNTGSQYGIINRAGETVVPFMYESIRFAFGENYIARLDGKYGVINLENETILDFEYLAMTFIDTGDFFMADKTTYMSVIIDNNFAERIVGIITDLDTERNFITVFANGENIFYNFSFERRNSRDILVANTLFLDRRDGRFGFVDSYGNVVVAHTYDDAKEQNRYGFAAVKRNR